MIRHSGRIGVVCLGLAVFCAVAVSNAEAQVAVVSAQPVKAWFADVRELASNAMPPEMFGQFAEFLDKISAPDAVKGLDASRTFGAFADLPSNGDPPLVAILIPVTEAEVFLQTVKGFGLGVEEAPAGSAYSHQLTLPDGRTKLFAFPMGKDLYLTLFPVRPARLRALTPEALDRARPRTSALTASIRLDRVSREVRDKFLAEYQVRLDSMQARQPGEAEPNYLGRLFGQELSSSALIGLIRDGREIAVDLATNPKNGPLSIDLRVHARPETSLAKAFVTFGAMQSRFRGLGPNSAVEAWGTIPSPALWRKSLPKFIELYKKEALAKAKSDDEKKSIESLLSLIEPTLLDESFDAAAAMKGPYRSDKPDAAPYVLMICLKVKSGEVLDKTLRERVKAKVANLIPDAAKSKDGKTPIYKGTTTYEAPDRMIGAKIHYVAIRENVVVMGIGEQSLLAVQEALEQIAKPPTATKSQLEVSMSTAQILRFSNNPAERDAGEAVAKSVFSGVDASKDRLRVSLQGGVEGLRLTLKGDASLLKFFYQMGMTMDQAVKP